jgi:hypothetical protein
VEVLNEWMNQASKGWSKSNPLGLNETLLVMRACALITTCPLSRYASPVRITRQVAFPILCILRANAAGVVGLALSISPAGCHVCFAWSP